MDILKIETDTICSDAAALVAAEGPADLLPTERVALWVAAGNSSALSKDRMFV